MPDTVQDNPIATEIIGGGKAILSAIVADESLQDQWGGKPALDDTFERLYLSCITLVPGVMYAPIEGINGLLTCAFFAGVSAERRRKHVEQQLRELGLE